MSYIIKIFCSFTTSRNCKEVYERINNVSDIEFYGKNKKIYITEDEDYTHAILINTPMPNLTIPKENVIGLAFEPVKFLGLSSIFIEYAKKNIGKYYIGDKNNLPEPFIEHFGYMWYSRPLKEITYKPNLMSIILSNKRSAPGHKYRHEMVKKIIEFGLPIDIYGRGSNNYSYDRVKGSFIDAEPYENYYFSICIENYECNHYFSEKIINPILYNCTPIYIGCKNIDNYLDNVIKMSGNIEKDILLIKDVITNPNNYYKKTYTEKHLRTVNLIENIDKLYS
jgi:hypothetical protein